MFPQLIFYWLFFKSPGKSEWAGMVKLACVHKSVNFNLLVHLYTNFCWDAWGKTYVTGFSVQLFGLCNNIICKYVLVWKYITDFWKVSMEGHFEVKVENFIQDVHPKSKIAVIKKVLGDLIGISVQFSLCSLCQ